MLAITVPFIAVEASLDINPSSIQNMLHAVALLDNTTTMTAIVSNATPILKINTAFGFPSAFKVKIPAIDPADLFNIRQLLKSFHYQKTGP